MSMKLRLTGLALAALTLAGCSGGWETSYNDVVSADASKTWRVAKVDVRVPESLSVSEDNSYAPQADIVCRREDRYAQVDAIITTAAKRGAAELNGRTPVQLVLQVQEFHALSEKARYGLDNVGVHNITFTAQVFDTKGQALTEPDLVRADLIALSGAEALAAEAKGQTQKVRITNHVAKVVAGWLQAGPDLRGSFSRAGR